MISSALEWSCTRARNLADDEFTHLIEQMTNRYFPQHLANCLLPICELLFFQLAHCKLIIVLRAFRDQTSTLKVNTDLRSRIDLALDVHLSTQGGNMAVDEIEANASAVWIILELLWELINIFPHLLHIET